MRSSHAAGDFQLRSYSPQSFLSSVPGLFQAVVGLGKKSPASELGKVGRYIDGRVGHSAGYRISHDQFAQPSSIHRPIPTALRVWSGLAGVVGRMWGSLSFALLLKHRRTRGVYKTYRYTQVYPKDEAGFQHQKRKNHGRIFQHKNSHHR